jgi:hypothetical protein
MNHKLGISRNRQRSVLRGFLKFILLRLSTSVMGYPIFAGRVLEQTLLRNFLKGVEILSRLSEKLERYVKAPARDELKPVLPPEEEFKLAKRLIIQRATLPKIKIKSELESASEDVTREYWNPDNRVICEIINYGDRLNPKVRFKILFVKDFNLIRDEDLLRLEAQEIRWEEIKSSPSEEEIKSPPSEKDLSPKIKFPSPEEVLSLSEESLSELMNEQVTSSIFIVDFKFLEGVFLKLSHLKMLDEEDLQEVLSIFDKPIKKRIISWRRELMSCRGLKTLPLEPEELQRLKKFWQETFELYACHFWGRSLYKHNRD